jgi:hypothetical protein
MRITRLPQPLVRREHGMVKDHVVLLNEDTRHPLAWRVNGTFAGYLAGKMAALMESPAAVRRLEARLAGERLLPEARLLLDDMVRTARRRQQAVEGVGGAGRPPHAPTPDG